MSSSILTTSTKPETTPIESTQRSDETTRTQDESDRVDPTQRDDGT